MFKLFKKEQSITTPDSFIPTPALITPYPEAVQRIHNDFFTASDKALEAANKILQEAAQRSSEKAKKLDKFGFSSVPEVTTSKQWEEKKERETKLINTIRYYRNKYPLYKYISEEDVKVVCEKYGLVLGPVNIFTGFVPERNLKELEEFTIEYADIQYKIGSKYIHAVDDGRIEWDGGRAVERSTNYKKVQDRDLQICAPAKNMAWRGWHQEGHKMVQSAPPDPIILQPVTKGGYLIVTAWGDEASDPLVVNEINN